MVSSGRVGAMLSAVCVVASIFVGPSAMAVPTAMPACYGASCEGKDPAATVCANDARTLLSKEVKINGASYGVLELRYSPRCYSNWARFTPWSGARAWLGNLAAGAEIGGSPWIWRKNVANTPRGKISQSSLTGASITYWTSMITAAGTTCVSVDVYQTRFSKSGGGSRDKLGTYNAPCIS